MDAISVVQLLLRRWRITVAMGLLTVATLAWVATAIPADYVAEGRAVLVMRPPDAQAPTSAVLAQLVEDGNVRSQLRREGAAAQYSLDVDTNGIIHVQATAASEAATVTTVRAVLESLDSVLSTRQDLLGLPQERRAWLEVLERPQAAESGQTPTGEQVWTALGAAQLHPPFESGSGMSLVSVGYLLAEYLGGSEVQEGLAREGLQATYVVTPSRETPSLLVTATSTSRDGALGTVRHVLESATDGIQSLRQLVATEDLSRIGVEPFLVPTDVEVGRMGILRSMVAVAALGGMLAVGLALLFEAIADSRRGREQTATTDQDDAEERAGEHGARGPEGLRVVRDPADDEDERPIDDATWELLESLSGDHRPPQQRVP